MSLRGEPVQAPNWKPPSGTHAKAKARRDRTRDRKWAKARAAALERDGWRCVRCHVPVMDHVHECHPNRAHVNHLHGRRGDRLYDLANLETLCQACHMPNGRHKKRAD